MGPEGAGEPLSSIGRAGLLLEFRPGTVLPPLGPFASDTEINTALRRQLPGPATLVQQSEVGGRPAHTRDGREPFLVGEHHEGGEEQGHEGPDPKPPPRARLGAPLQVPPRATAACLLWKASPHYPRDRWPCQLDQSKAALPRALPSDLRGCVGPTACAASDRRGHPQPSRGCPGVWGRSVPPRRQRPPGEVRVAYSPARHTGPAPQRAAR